MSMIQAVELSYVRGVCGVNKVDDEGNETVYRCGMFTKRGGEMQHPEMVRSPGENKVIVR